MDIKNYLDNKIFSLKGKTVVITGANSGIGFSLAKQASYKGANVILACRNKQRADKAIELIKNEVKDSNPLFMEYDQSNFGVIDKFVDELTSLGKINTLVLNAGVFKPGKDLKTNEGYSLTVGTNYIGEFYLINKLDNLIKSNKIEQIIVVSSIGRWFAPKNYLSYLEDDHNKLVRAYFSSKKMNFEIAFFLKRKYSDLKVNIVHPGIATTRIVDNELNSYSKFWNRVGNVVLKLIANSSDKSGLCLSLAVSEENKEGINYYYPRRIFHTAGFPSYKKYKVNKIKSTELIDASYKLINH